MANSLRFFDISSSPFEVEMVIRNTSGTAVGYMSIGQPDLYCAPRYYAVLEGYQGHPDLDTRYTPPYPPSSSEGYDPEDVPWDTVEVVDLERLRSLIGTPIHEVPEEEGLIEVETLNLPAWEEIVETFYEGFYD